MAQKDGTVRKESISDLEVIEFKPPIDLIPDEYVRDNNKNVLVEMVCDGNDSEALDLGNLLSEYGFSVNVTDGEKEKLNHKPNELWINKVQDKIKEKPYDGILMIFAKVFYTNKDMKLIWSKFTTRQCPELKNKPKIFIFQTRKQVGSDTVMVLPHGRTAYDTPAEADLLIIYDRYDEDRAGLLDYIQENIERYGDQEDLITLASFGYGFDYQPLIISTMTRKFFIKIHNYRGYHFEYFSKNDVVKSRISKFKEIVIGKHPEKTEASSFLKSIKKKFSFRKKKDERKNEGGESSSRSSTQSFREIIRTTEEKEQNNVKLDETEIQSPTADVQEPSKPVIKSRPQKPNTNPRDTEIRKSKRISTTSSTSGDRPAWKP